MSKNGFIESGKLLAKVKHNGAMITEETSTREERKKLLASLAGYCARHSKPVKVMSGEGGTLYLQRVQS
jgi:hypothetical protein